jgi:HEAT repeat protein
MAADPRDGKGRRKTWVTLTAWAAIAVAIGIYFFRSPQQEGARRVVGRIARAARSLVGMQDRARKPVEVIVREIELGDEAQRTQSIAFLQNELIKPAEFAQVLPCLVQAMKDESEMVRETAVPALRALIVRYAHKESAEDERKLEEALVGLLNESSATLRVNAARLLRTLAATRQLDVPPPRLVACLDDESDQVRAAAAESLIEYGQGPELFLPVALRRLPTERPIARQEFTRILWNIRFRPTVLPLLVEELSSENALVCVSAATAINHMGLDARSARPAVMSLLRKELETPHAGQTERNDTKAFAAVDIIEQTSEALAQLSPDGDVLPGTVEILCEVLRHQNEKRQPAAAWSLGILGRAATSAVPLLIATFEANAKAPSEFRGTIALSLAEIARATSEQDRVIASLAKAWATAPGRLKVDLAKALRSLGPKSETLVLELRQMPPDATPSRIQRGRNPRSFLEGGIRSRN